MKLSELDEITLRCAEQIENISMVSKNEAMMTCLAYARIFPIILAQIAPSEAELNAKLTQLFDLMRREALSARCKTRASRVP